RGGGGAWIESRIGQARSQDRHRGVGSSRGALALGCRSSSLRARHRPNELPVFAEAVAVAPKARRRLRSRNRKRDLAIFEFCGLVPLCRLAHSLFRFPSRDARPVVQGNVSAQAFQKMALLAVG